jgi:hypothetical protein
MADYRNMFGPPIVDFSTLGQLGSTYMGARKVAEDREREQMMQRELKSLADMGKLDANAIGLAALKTGNVNAAMAAAQLAASQNDRTFNQGIATRRQNLDELQATIPYKKQVAEATKEAKGPREMSVTDIGKLNEEGNKFANLTGFVDRFEDRFGGYGMQMVGEAATKAGRFLPEGVVGKDVADGASFWQGYDRFKNTVRNELFGSALTAPEVASFEKADINPGMTPAQIRNNLKIQKDLYEKGLKKKAATLTAGGFDPKVVNSAYGIGGATVGGVSGQPAQAAASTMKPPNFDGAPEGKRWKATDGSGKSVVVVKRNGQLVPE